MWEKLKELFWGIRFHIRDKYQTIRYWFELNLNKYHFNVVLESFKGFPYDYAYIWKLERAKLLEMKRYFIKSSDEFEHERDIYWIDICIKLLNILIEDDLWDYQTEDGKVYKSDDIIECDFGSLMAFFNRGVNIRNYRRFIRIYDEDELRYNTFKHTLYREKVRHLYYEILKNKIEGWWD